MSIDDMVAVLPLVITACGALLVILMDSFSSPETPRKYLGGFSVVFLAAAGIAALQGLHEGHEAFGGLVVMDGLAGFLTVIIMLSAGMAAALAMGRLPEKGAARGEFYALLLFSAGGGSLLASANDLVTVFLGLETLSIPAYAMAASLRRDPRSAEAGFKYFILGAFASGIFLMGTALVYGGIGSTSLARLAVATASGPGASMLAIMGAVMLLAGLAFKAAAVPFHMWAPDAYTGSPTPTTAYFAAGVKAAAFAALLRVVMSSMPGLRAMDVDTGQTGWFYVVWALAAGTIVLPSLTALVQKDVKRILAYSSVTHAGYLLVGLLAGRDGGTAILFYLLAYAFMTVGAFAIVAYMERENGGTGLSDYAGMAKRHPYASAALAVFLFSLAGIPPTGGFFAKFYLFKAAVENGVVNLTILALLFSVVSAYYYLRIVVAMYMESGTEDKVSVVPSAPVAAVVILCFVLTLAMGLYPSPYLAVARASAAVLP